MVQFQLLIWSQHEDLLQQLSRSRNIDKGVDVDVGEGGHQELAVKSDEGGGHSYGPDKTRTCP